MTTSKFVHPGHSASYARQTTVAPSTFEEMVQAEPVVRRMSVQQMVARFNHVPTQTTILGVCDDGLPVLFDLTEDRPGPLLVCGDPACGKTALMQAMLQTTVALNSPYEVKYSVIASNPDEWAEFDTNGQDKHCMSFHGYYEDGAGETILRMAEIAEQRRSGREMGAALLLMVDDLSWIAKADFDVKLNFEWLLKNGPALQVWPVVSLPTQPALEMSRLTTYFRTRLIGHMPGNTNRRLTLFDGLESENLDPGKQFAVRVEDQWLKFWLPVR